MGQSGNGDDNVEIPDELRCKRSDGKQWRCTSKSMPDKTVCEKHYIQAKKRAASSALRASIKKSKRKSFGESDTYLESKMDDFDFPVKNGDHRSLTNPKKKKKSKGLKNQIHHSPDKTPFHNSMDGGDDSRSDTEEFEDEWRSNNATNLATGNPSKNRSQMSFDAGPSTEESDGNVDSSENAGGITCHHCRKNDMDIVFWCSRCDRRGYCNSCISQWYSSISIEDIQKACPACRGTCSCRVCLRGDVLLKMKIREIPIIDKLQYLYSLLSSVLPVIQRIHQEQLAEVQLEKSLHGAEINLARAKLNEDEQMCCNVCRIPIIDYHRHCTSCSYDVCLYCCKDLREESDEEAEGTLVRNQNTAEDQNGYALDHLRDTPRLNLSNSFPDWEADSDGNIPCLPKPYGGCGYRNLSLSRIFKMNWVAKLVKNVEEIVSGCKVNDSADELNVEPNMREDSSDHTLYCPTSENIKTRIIDFRKHWVKGKPILVKEVWDDSSCLSSWSPTDILRGIQDTAEDRTKCENVRVKAIDCLSCSEIDIDLDQFIKGYSEGRKRSTGLPEMLKLKDWPSPSASEDFLLYQRAEFINKFPLLEYIHSKWGVLNVAAKLPHYSLQNDVGPQILISYGTKHELGKGDPVTNLHYKMRDMVYLLAHTHYVKSEIQQISVESTQKCDTYFDVKETNGDSNEEKYSSHFYSENGVKENYGGHLVEYNDERMDEGEIGKTFPNEGRNFDSSRDNDENFGKKLPGTLWDVFKREDIPKLMEYLEKNWKDLGNVDSVSHHLFDEAVYLSWQHKRQLKDEFGIEPWSFEQRLGEAVFIPAGCPFQLRNLQSTVQLALDFLSPESLGVAVKLAEEVRCLPNDHEAKVQILEVGKISLYAASSAIKEVQKLVLNPKSISEINFEDPNLTALVSENLEKITKRKQFVP